MDNNVSQVKTSDKTIMNINNKLSKYTSELSKKVASLKEESKEKTDAVKTYIKEDSPLKNGMTVLQKKVKEELLKQESPESEEENSESKLRKLTSGLGKKIKDIKTDIVEIKDESLQSLSDLKEIYQEKAEQKKAIINSFTEEEVKILRKGTQLPAQFSKQMNTLYLSKRLSVVRFSVLSCKYLDKDQLRGYDSVYVKTAIGLEKFKTKIISIAGSDKFHWDETSSLSRQTAEDKHFEVEIYARNSKETVLAGKSQIDLNTLESDSLNHLEVKLRDSSLISVCVLELVLWVTGVNDTEPGADILKNTSDASNKDIAVVKDPEESVASLSLTVLQATGLGSSKLQGWS